MLNNSSNIYFNIDIRNNTNNTVEAKFNETRTTPVLDNPIEYRVCVNRFTIPGSLIPIRHSQDVLNQFNISLGVGSTSYTEDVKSSDVDNGTNYIYSYQDVTRPITQAFERAFNNLKIAIPSLTSTEGPKVTFYESTSLFLIRIPLSYYTDNIDIYINEDFWAFFKFPSKKISPPVINDRQIKYYDNGINTDFTLGYTFFYQPYRTSSRFTDLKQVFFKTNINIDSEIIGSQNTNTVNILTDFDPLINATATDTRLSFFPQGPQRWYDLRSHHSLHNINLQIYYNVTTSDIIYPLLLDSDEFANIKLQFRKKNLNL